MKKIVIYDNTIKPNEIIREVIGEKGFGDVVVKRKLLKDFYRENIAEMFGDIVWKEINSLYDVELLLNEVNQWDRKVEVKILHCFSNFIISNQEETALTYIKLLYITENIVIQSENRNCSIMFCDMEAYVEFLEKVLEVQNVEKVAEQLHFEELSIQGLNYIGEIYNFIQCITGNFDSRYFNSLQGTEYRLRKSSTNKKKIKSEYEYYHLLPETMQSWFVMPFDYQEDDQTASYAMERLHMTDIAIKWVHGSIKTEEFSDLMDMYFYFFNERSKKEVSKEEYEKISRRI